MAAVAKPFVPQSLPLIAEPTNHSVVGYNKTLNIKDLWDGRGPYSLINKGFSNSDRLGSYVVSSLIERYLHHCGRHTAINLDSL